jgi:hypothetical protein
MMSPSDLVENANFVLKVCFFYSFVAYAIARSGGVASMAIYIVVAVLTTLTAEDRAEAAPAAALVEELALEEAVVLPPVPAENPGVCT